MNNITRYTASELKPKILQLARRAERLYLGRLKKGKKNDSSDLEITKLMMIYNSIDWWEPKKIKSLTLWLRLNYGV